MFSGGITSMSMGAGQVAALDGDQSIGVGEIYGGQSYSTMIWCIIFSIVVLYFIYIVVVSLNEGKLVLMG